jgi:hypothetical protein
MNDVLELIQAVHALGAELRAEPPDLVIKPAGKVPPELKMRLREHKPELLALLNAKQPKLCFHCAGLRLCDCISCNAGLVLENGDFRVKPGTCVACCRKASQ